ncbi:AHH domain-containing protein [Clostridium estertheticum]|uniref:AHH domain-containing protein n=1 Tax=Clostridium estertheticum TaxID=238834 RepID=UPI001CF2247F|nr:AHH domain-containing protein [Clostridium estertheticum]MCB2309223.1 AHH domain-containing protein [Clostridium estertheticum]MCB2347646.1 AHH domain-containing protein [Clostridium estertheticum]MCB2352179.1 AHH domain-containing protein [Clostridium estertheticum]WAG45275.1 AHH domain-containing protein [Clostridium estertheticum]
MVVIVKAVATICFCNCRFSPKGVAQAKPNQVHHFATNKSKKYTQQFEQITNKYKLNLDDMWNKELMPHQGRHPYAYHDYMLEQMKKFDKIANGNQDKFLKLYEQVKQKVINNPDMITKDYWNKK